MERIGFLSGYSIPDGSKIHFPEVEDCPKVEVEIYEAGEMGGRDFCGNERGGAETPSMDLNCSRENLWARFVPRVEYPLSEDPIIATPVRKINLETHLYLKESYFDIKNEIKLFVIET